MTEVDDAVAVVTEMLEHADAQRPSDALASAERAIRLAREIENRAVGGILGAIATSTWLTSKAVLNPEDLSLIDECDGVFKLFSESGLDQGATTAIVALGVKIQLLLQARRPGRPSWCLSSWRPFTPTDQLGASLWSRAERSSGLLPTWSRCKPAQAGALARRVVDRFATVESPEERVLAATAQAWVVIATMARDDKAGLGFAAPAGERRRAPVDARCRRSARPGGGRDGDERAHRDG